MKRKTILRVCAVLLSAGFVMNTVNTSTGRIAAAEELTTLENREELFHTESMDDQELTESQEKDEEADDLHEEVIGEPETDRIIDDAENLQEELPESETETESETAAETESETEEVPLASVRLNLDQNLEAVPTVFAEYLNDLDVYTVTLVYSDGSESTLNQTDKRYTLSVDYEDAEESAGTIGRTYHATVMEQSTGKKFEDHQYIELGKEDPVEIKTEEMTSVILEGKKKWVIVQSTPDITGRYAMNSDKLIESIYYVSDAGEVTCAEDAFQLQEGTTYQFLIKLK